MNKNVSDDFRAEIKSGLEKCTAKEREVFVRMYGPQEQLRNDMFMYDVAAIAKNNIDIIVDRMPIEKLDWAMQQVRATVNKK